MPRLFRTVVAIGAGIVALSNIASPASPQPVELLPLKLEAKIPLGDVRGRIDHMAIDLERQRLFIAELGNDSVSIVDLKDRKVLHRISGLKEPQGVGFAASTGTFYVASAGDGSLRLFQRENYSDIGRIDLGEDADNIRIDEAGNRVIVGYGSGALAVIDATTRGKIADIPLKGHPESFQLSRDGGRIFVNVPNAREIAVVDRSAAKQVASWPMRSAAGNFPMALDEETGQVFTVFRNPAKLGVFAMRDGTSLATTDICGDADDIFLDAKRHRLYVSCGDGSLDVIEVQGGFRRIARVPTISGARTALFVPDLDRLYLAVRAQRGEPAAVWIFQPLP
jgi:DNA-binding beta-propeller fold protein YncE